MATYQGQKIAERMASDRSENNRPENAGAGNDNSDNPFVGIPFPGAPLGLYNGKPWFLPFAGAWYKFLDWIS
jgi:hypothetical protein